MKVLVRSRIRKYLGHHGPSTCYEIFAYLKENLSGRVAPSNPKAVGSMCARDPDIKVVGTKFTGKFDVKIYDLKERVRRNDKDVS